MPHTPLASSESLLDELRTWVEIETPTTEPSAVNRLMDVAESGLRQAGADLTRIPGRDGYGDNLVARTPGRRQADPDRRPPRHGLVASARSKKCRSASKATRRTAPASTT